MMMRNPAQKIRPEEDRSDRAAQPARRRWKLQAVLAAGIGAAALVVFFGIGRWLVVQDPLQKADAVVVLSGRLPIRAPEAARIYKAGYAPQVWLTRTEEPEASLKRMDIPYVGEEFYNLRVLVHEGVPAEAIRVLPGAIVNTADEMQAVGAELHRMQGRTVIFVTSKAHTRRVRTLWRRISGGSGRAIVRVAEEDPFDPQHWWRTSSDALDVLREVLGLFNAWAGLLLPPARGT